MPTNHDETLEQRYAREQSEHLAELTKRTPEEIAYMEQLLHNVLAERDQLLAALKAIKQITDGSQPIDAAGAAMVAESAIAAAAEAAQPIVKLESDTEAGKWALAWNTALVECAHILGMVAGDSLTDVPEVLRQRLASSAQPVADLELALFAENQKRADVERERDQLLSALKSAKHMLERDYIDDAKMRVVEQCDAAIEAVKGDTV